MASTLFFLMWNSFLNFDLRWLLRTLVTHSLGLAFLASLVRAVDLSGIDQILQALSSLGKCWIEFSYSLWNWVWECDLFFFSKKWEMKWYVTPGWKFKEGGHNSSDCLCTAVVNVEVHLDKMSFSLDPWIATMNRTLILIPTTKANNWDLRGSLLLGHT